MKTDKPNEIQLYVEKAIQTKYIQTASSEGYYELDISDLDLHCNEIIDKKGLETIINEIQKELIKYSKQNQFEQIPEIRLTNVPSRFNLHIDDIGAENIGKLVVVKGTIIAMEPKQTIISTAKYKCRSCMGIVEQKLVDNKLIPPAVCNSCGARAFQLLEDESEFEDIRNIILEETSGEKTQPPRIKVQIEGKQTKQVDLNQEVEIIGISSRDDKPIKNGQSNKESIIKANTINPTKQKQIILTEKDKQQNIELSKEEKIIDILAESIAPTIKLPIEIKKGLLCYLVKGELIGNSDRKEIHILFLGDPSTAKSKISRELMKLTSKCTYADGTLSSGVGLTASVVKEPLLNTNVVELGAFPKANGGHCCIDEFDKLPQEQTNDLLNALETGILNIQKSGVHEELETKVSTLALANPKFGRFDPYKSISEQVLFSAPLLSRFDLQFLHIDKPDAKNDAEIVERMLTSQNSYENYEGILPTDDLQKYLEQARQTSVKLSPEAKEKSKEWYVQLRNGEQYSDDTPIHANTRTLQSLIRIASAFTKLKLKDIITITEIQEAEEIMNYSLKQMGLDPTTNQIDIDRVNGNVTYDDRHTRNIILDTIKELIPERIGGIKQSELMKVLSEQKDISRRKYYKHIEELRVHGDITIIQEGRYKIIKLCESNIN